MKLRYKLLDPRAKAPYHGSDGAGGYDLYALEAFNLYHYHIIWYRTGVAVEIPEGYIGLICPRSSCWKQAVVPHMSPTVVDSDYRGEIWVCFTKLPYDPNPNYQVRYMGDTGYAMVDADGNTHDGKLNELHFGPFRNASDYSAWRDPYLVGERIAQLVVVPAAFGASLELEEVSALAPSKRDEAGFGSTGVK